MHDSRAGAFSNALTWLELSYSSLKADALAVFGVITLVIILLCAGAYQEAVRQAHLMLSMPAPQDSGMMQIVDLVNQYGFGVLVAICYFSNATSAGLRRELFIDIVCILLGVLLPQLVFHGTFVWSMQDIVSFNNLSVNAAAIQTLNLEWLVVWTISMLLVGLAFVAWRFAQRHAR